MSREYVDNEHTSTERSRSPDNSLKSISFAHEIDMNIKKIREEVSDVNLADISISKQTYSHNDSPLARYSPTKDQTNSGINVISKA